MSLLEHSMPLLNGEMQDLTAYAGKVVLIVNTASQCGFTYQYEGLETLWKDYADKGLVILGFPCNQFGKQEPGDSAEIGSFCQKNYGVTFPMFSKIEVNGANAAPLYQQLKKAAPGVLGTQGIKWNFTKFLVNRKGEVVGRFAPTDKPESLRQHIEKELEKNQ
ncbi:MAG: glutathione peroxidase [Oceanospirillaceae bacterium]|nr:glutathione peroxidase [Oceanospirillaceae bacterium]|tara:strand:+ start:595 stop:1083 length:489 start_codon:yes stop_codon:yes gene_type:complete